MSDSQLAKFEGKLELSGEFGEKCQEQAIAAEREAQGRKGASEALRLTGSQINKQLTALLDKEWEDGEFADCTTPEAARAKVKRCITRAVGFCEHISAAAKNAELVSSGKAVALRQVAEMAGKHNDAAAARIRQLQAPREPNDPDNPDLDGKGNPRRASGERPMTVPEMADVKAAAIKGKKKSSKKKSSKKKSSKKSAGKAPASKTSSAKARTRRQGF